MEKWSDGVYLVGRYNYLEAGCWMFLHEKEAAILEMPPYGEGQISPAISCFQYCEENSIQVKYLICSHCHFDHISSKTLTEFIHAFPKAKVIFQENFDQKFKKKRRHSLLPRTRNFISARKRTVFDPCS